MKNTNTKFLLVASVAALLSSNVNAAGTATASASDTAPSLSDAVQYLLITHKQLQ